VAIVLAIAPYLILRGLVTRVARMKRGDFRTRGKQPPMNRAA
jgi:hypothetical protein